MSSAEIKRDIIRLIDQIEDNDKLQQAYQKLLSFLGTAEPGPDELNPKLEESLTISLKQVAEGKVKSHEEVMTKYREKFGR